jgi:hypothetical protein
MPSDGGAEGMGQPGRVNTGGPSGAVTTSFNPEVSDTKERSCEDRVMIPAVSRPSTQIQQQAS